MGKPFGEEIKKIQDTYDWALNVPIENLEYIQDFLLKKSLFVVGSGGSTCSCCLFSMLHQEEGQMASPITPLELQYVKNAINKNTNVVFISAGGRNSDILFAFDTAVNQEPSNILSICFKENSPLAKKSFKYSISKMISLENPAGKDGFLATNSTIAYFTIISRLYNKAIHIKNLIPSQIFLSQISNFSKALDEDFTITVLYSGWSKPVALDIESKFSEAGLGNILLTDYRNFGHGRHNWFDKKRRQSAIVALINNDDEELATKTLSLLPKDIPILQIVSKNVSSNASIDLLVKSFYLVEEIGKLKGIDPGRPGVPSYGSQLYHLKYSKFYAEKNILSTNVRNAIKRKFGDPNLPSNELFLPFWIESYKNFITNIKKTKFKGIMLDYDGTICSIEERFDSPRDEIAEKLKYFLQNGITVGIVTGRGKSVRETLQKIIPQEYWQYFLIGYYNGAQIGTLDDNNLPIIENDIDLFADIEKILKSENLINNHCDITLRKGQLTIMVKNKKKSEIVKNTMKDILKKLYPFEIQILESSHSIDIISVETSKNLIVDYYNDKFKDEEKMDNFLFIGDRGKWPGNDFQLLSNKFSLSVDQVSNDPYTCWNLSSIGNNCVETTLEYFEAITLFENGYFKIKL